MQMLINGKSVGAKETFDVLNPATLERIDSAPRATSAELDQAVEAALAAFAGWRRDLDARRKALQQGAALIREHRDEIARLLVQEQGKPLAEATGEVVFASIFFAFFAGLDYREKTLKEDEASVVKLLRSHSAWSRPSRRGISRSRSSPGSSPRRCLWATRSSRSPLPTRRCPRSG